MVERTISILEDDGVYTIMDYTAGMMMVANRRPLTVAMAKLETYLRKVEK